MASHELLDEPAITQGDRRDVQKAEHILALLCNEDSPVREIRERFRLDQKMQTWKSTRGEPFRKDGVKMWVIRGISGAPSLHHDALVPCSVKLRAKRALLLHYASKLDWTPHGLRA
jgi:hypothetical protein